jgi:hypothetical protein
MCVSCEPAIKGRLVDDHYYDSNGWFYVKIRPADRHQIQEHATPNLSAVSFQDNMGGLIRFEVIPISNEDLVEAKKCLDGNPAIYKNIFLESYLPTIVSRFPGTKIIHEEMVSENNENQAFFLLDIPGGGTSFNSTTGRQTDSFRGFLIFLSGNQLVVESFQYCLISSDVFRSEYQKGDTSVFANTLRLLREYKQGYKNLCDCE